MLGGQFHPTNPWETSWNTTSSRYEKIDHIISYQGLHKFIVLIQLVNYSKFRTIVLDSFRNWRPTNGRFSWSWWCVNGRAQEKMVTSLKSVIPVNKIVDHLPRPFLIPNNDLFYIKYIIEVTERRKIINYLNMFL